MAGTNPFLKNTAPAAPAAPAAVSAAAEEVVKKERKKKEGPRKVPAPQLTKDDRRFIMEHYASMETSEIAQNLSRTHGKEVTRQQVYRTVLDTRTKLEERLAKATADGDKVTIGKIQGLLEALPKKAFGGGRGGGGRRGSSVDSLLDELLG